MINLVIFSKDRAAQLDLLLSSMAKYFRQWREQSVSVLYTHSSEPYAAGYRRVMELHPEVHFVRESSFKDDLVDLFNERSRPYTSFMVDDDMFIDTLDLDSPEFALFQSDRRILCLSCRMSPRMDIFFMKNRPQEVPRFGPGRTWRWKGLKGDWGYPMSAGGMHIFRTPDLVDAVVGCEYTNPNTFEDHALLEMPPARPLMVCFEEAKVFCAAVNKVQTLNENRHSNSFPLEVLNETFLSGKRLSPHTHHQWRSRSPHGEARYEWLPEEVGVAGSGQASGPGGVPGRG